MRIRKQSPKIHVLIVKKSDIISWIVHNLRRIKVRVNTRSLVSLEEHTYNRSSSEGSSSESDEADSFCLMAHHHKKKNVSHSKYEPIYDMSYYELQTAFKNLYGEVVDAFKRFASNKRIFHTLKSKF